MSESAAETTARALLEAGALLMRPEQPFRLTSGLNAPFYVNCRTILSHVSARSRVADALAATVAEVDMVAGGVTAGVPFATLVADRLELPLVYVRAEAKAHGTGGQIEGCAVAGKRIVLIEDLITTAGSILKFAQALRGAGARIERVSVVFARMIETALPALRETGLTLTVLCDLDTLLAIAEREGFATAAAFAEARAFLADPEAWSARHAA